MPIVYEPPQPFAPGISSGYGAAEQGIQDLPLIQHAQDARDANRRAEFQGQLQSNALAEQAGQQNANRQSAEAARGAAMREGAVQFDASQRPSPRDYFQADLGFAQTQQRFALHAQMQQQELSQAETMRLQRLQQAKGTIQQQVDEGQLTPEEGNSLMTQAQTGINPLQQRQAAQKVKLEQLQTEQLMHQQAQQKTFELQNQEHEARAKEQGIGILKRLNPHTGLEETLFQNPKTGEWYNPWITHDTLTNEQSGKKEKEAANLDAIRLKDYERAAERIQRANEVWAAQRDKQEEAKALKDGRTPELTTPDQIHQNYLTDLKRAGLEPTWEAQRAKMMGQDAAKQQPVSVTGSGQIPAPAAGPEQPPEPPEPPKPFQWGERSTQTPAQATLVRQFGLDRREVEQDKDLGDFRRQQVLSAMDLAKSILERTGGVAPPPGDPRRPQLDALNAFIQANKPRKLQPAPAAREPWFNRYQPPAGGGGGY